MKKTPRKPYKGTSLTLARYGGLNMVKQKGNYGRNTYHSAPERVGTYAMIWPYIELFLVMSTKQKEFKEGTYKKFEAVGGTLWTHFEPKDKSMILEISASETWYKVRVSDMTTIIKQEYAQELKWRSRDKTWWGKDGPQKEDIRCNPWRWCSKDHFEVFITHDTKFS